jgi:hypothetical protein
LINEANLVFHIDAAAMAGSKSQIEFIYTTSNNQSILDYKLDGSSGLKPKMANLYIAEL